MRHGAFGLVTNEVSAVIAEEQGEGGGKGKGSAFWGGGASASLVKPCGGTIAFKVASKSIRLRKAPHSRAKRKAGLCAGASNGVKGSGGSGGSGGTGQTAMSMARIEAEEIFDITAAGIVEAE